MFVSCSIRRPFAAAIIFLFALIAGDIRTGHASQESAEMSVILSQRCVMAFIVAMEDLREWYASKPSPLYTEFKEYFQYVHGDVRCSENENRIFIYIFRSDPFIRGGGIRYTIDKKDGKILKRVFDR